MIQTVAGNLTGLRAGMEAPPDATRFAPTWRGLAFRLWLLFAAELLIVAALSIPRALSLNLWLFEDPGAILTTNFLIMKGYQPAVDFGYIYGLLPLLLVRGWLALFGASPISAWAAMLASALFLAWGLARFLAGLRLGWPGRTLIALTIPFSTIVVPPHVVHILEAAFIVNGLAEQARGRRDLALVYAVLAVFCKPTMGYLYGLLLVLEASVETIIVGKAVRSLIQEFIPAVGATLVGILLLSWAYGARAVARTLLPLAGMRTYQALAHMGFFHGDGRNFWHPAGARWTFYLGTEAGFWLAATFILLLGASVCAVRLWSKESGARAHRRAAEMVVVCAILHFSFVLMFFGNRGSWMYYSFLPVLGLSALTDLAPRSVVCAMVGLGVLSIVGYKTRFSLLAKDWRLTAPSVETDGLWTSTLERTEWAQVLALNKKYGGRAILVSTEGSGPLLFSGFLEPVSAYQFRGEASERDVQREVARFANANLVIFAYPQRDYGLPAYWPSVAAQWATFRKVWQGKVFEVYARSDNRSLQVVQP